VSRRREAAVAVLVWIALPLLFWIEIAMVLERVL
jgi:hypothetical protein